MTLLFGAVFVGYSGYNLRMSRYRKTAVLGLGVVAVVLATVVLKNPILEPWYLWKLESDSNLAQETAAAYFGRVKSAEAVPRLAEIMAQGGKYRSPDHYSVRALIHIGSPSVPPLIELLRHEEEAVRQAAEEALENIAPQVKDATTRRLLLWARLDRLFSTAPAGVGDYRTLGRAGVGDYRTRGR